MRITWHELYKLWRNKAFLGALFALLAANLLLLWYTQSLEAKPERGAYLLIRGQLGALQSEQQKLDFLKAELERATAYEMLWNIAELQAQGVPAQRAKELCVQQPNGLILYQKYIAQYEPKVQPIYGSSFSQEAAFLARLVDECQQVGAYQSRLQQIFDKAQRLGGISIFAQGRHSEYFAQNVQMTREAYGAFVGRLLPYDVSDGFLLATNTLSTDVLLCIAAFLMAGTLLYAEKQNGLLRLARVTAWGRAPLMWAKLAAVALSLVAVVLLFYASNLIYAGVRFGFDDFAGPLQARGAFLDSVLPLTLGGIGPSL